MEGVRILDVLNMTKSGPYLKKIPVSDLSVRQGEARHFLKEELNIFKISNGEFMTKLILYKLRRSLNIHNGLV